MNTSLLEQKVDLLIGVIQDLNVKVNDLHSNQKPSHNWLSSKELANCIGVGDKCIIKWVKQNLLPEDCYTKRPRGKYFIYKFNARKAIPIAEKLRTGERG